MYCPNCSQQQVSDEMSFCSRCGFSLTAVKQLVASGTGLVGPQLSRGQCHVRKGTWMMLASLLLTIFAGLVTAVDDDFAPILIVPFLCYLIGFALLLYGVFFADKRAANAALAAQKLVVPMMPAQLGYIARSPQLPPQRVAPVESFTPQRANTAEIIHPPSVTENTTKLLDEESDRRR